MGRAGLDHCFVVDSDESNAIRLSVNNNSVMQTYTGESGAKDQLKVVAMNKVAVLRDPVSGRELCLHATQPGVQVNMFGLTSI